MIASSLVKSRNNITIAHVTGNFCNFLKHAWYQSLILFCPMQLPTLILVTLSSKHLQNTFSLGTVERGCGKTPWGTLKFIFTTWSQANISIGKSVLLFSKLSVKEKRVGHSLPRKPNRIAQLQEAARCWRQKLIH